MKPKKQKPIGAMEFYQCGDYLVAILPARVDGELDCYAGVAMRHPKEKRPNIREGVAQAARRCIRAMTHADAVRDGDVGMARLLAKARALELTNDAINKEMDRLRVVNKVLLGDLDRSKVANRAMLDRKV